MPLSAAARIYRFTGSWEFLSNFYPVVIPFQGQMYPSVEHAYQASKTLNVKEREQIRTCGSAGKAKHLGSPAGIVTIRKDWPKLREGLMRQFLEEKFRPGTPLCTLLLETGEAELVEGNNWHDNYWGNCICGRCKDIPGQNHLGRLLMEVRTLRQQGL